MNDKIKWAGLGLLAWLLLKPKKLYVTAANGLSLVDLPDKKPKSFPTETFYATGEPLGTIAGGKPMEFDGYQLIYIRSSKNPKIYHAVDVNDIKQFTSTSKPKIGGVKKSKNAIWYRDYTGRWVKSRLPATIANLKKIQKEKALNGNAEIFYN